MKITAAAFLTLTALPLLAQEKQPAWVRTSDGYTQLLLDLDKKYSPESASGQGLAQFDADISVPTLANEDAQRKDTEAVLAKLVSAEKSEPDELVRQDLDILIDSTQRDFKRQDYSRAHNVPFINAAGYVYSGIEALLDDQVTPDRRKAALVRLAKYTGQTKGFQPITAILRQRTEEQIAKPGMIYPAKMRMELELSRNKARVDGIADLFRKYKLTGWEANYALLQKQLTDYDTWLKATVLPKARTDFRLTPEEYALNFADYGIDITPAQIDRLAHAAFQDYQAQMQQIATRIAQRDHLPNSDYRYVIAQLKLKQMTNDEILPFYEKRLHAIEEIIETQHLVTLPDRPAIIRLGSPAESVQQPAPHMIPPPFLNNTGQRGVFVLPLNMPAVGGAAAQKVDDYTFDAATWTLIAHEARPGHELQFDSMVEHGVSKARALYAFNSTNAEGWGLYAEYITLPYMPLEGQLISLQFRLLRAARAFLDPELQSGKVTPQEAMRVLTSDVGMSVPFANQEVERYTFRMPGQANSYFYGYTRLLELRKSTQAALGPKFNQQRFHDFILAQGLLPPNLMKKAVEDHFIPDEQKK
ncbi:DUF885 domain-containing protein [Terriglobus tenax]|uniref:DUF885 domain-containing protein n=1 Tax=Terriglobus tenax TaxID=1111115 RepID=UPI0021DFCFA8|nr:DUF885 domain-containing protein [Terriglobus tenax]